MSKTKGTHQVISAGHTATGAPVYLTAGRTWSSRLSEALALEDATEVEQLLAWAAQQEREICDPYSFTTTLANGVPEPLSARERIRETGPTTRLRRPD